MNSSIHIIRAPRPPGPQKDMTDQALRRWAANDYYKFVKGGTLE